MHFGGVHAIMLISYILYINGRGVAFFPLLLGGWRLPSRMKALRRFLSVVNGLLVTAVVVLAILLAGLRLVGLTPYSVLSGSMEPTYHVGALIYVQKAAPEEISVGDPITFVVNADLLVATHRVVEIEKITTKLEPILDEEGNPVLDEEGNPMAMEVELDEPSYYYTTKGDANEAIDGTPVWHKNLVGRPVFTVPYLGYLSSYLQTRQGMIVGVAAGLIILILAFLPDLLRSADEADAEKAKAKKRKKRKKESA